MKRKDMTSAIDDQPLRQPRKIKVRCKELGYNGRNLRTLALAAMTKRTATKDDDDDDSLELVS